MFHTVDDETLRLWYSKAKYSQLDADDITKIGNGAYFNIQARGLYGLIKWLNQYPHPEYDYGIMAPHHQAMLDAIGKYSPDIKLRLPRIVAAVLTYEFWLQRHDKPADWFDPTNISPLALWEPRQEPELELKEVEPVARTMEEEIDYAVGIAMEESLIAFRHELFTHKQRIDTQRTNIKVLEERLAIHKYNCTVALRVIAATAFVLMMIGFVIFYYYFN